MGLAAIAAAAKFFNESWVSGLPAQQRTGLGRFRCLVEQKYLGETISEPRTPPGRTLGSLQGLQQRRQQLLSVLRRWGSGRSR